jgi:hypothetical protein
MEISLKLDKRPSVNLPYNHSAYRGKSKCPEFPILLERGRNEQGSCNCSVIVLGQAGVI